jgi:hypothetical protein
MAGYGRTLTGTETEAMRCLAALDALTGPLWGTSSHEHEVTSPARMTIRPGSSGQPDLGTAPRGWPTSLRWPVRCGQVPPTLRAT